MATVGRIYIDGEIIPDAWNWWGDEATSLISVRNQIAGLGDFDELEYWIFSPGGFCSEGWAIADYLLTLGKKLTSVAYGQCASIATVIQSVASVRKITQNCDFMIHLPWGGCEGDEYVHRDYAQELQEEGFKIASRYAQTTGGDAAAIKEQMRTELHMNGQQAVDAKYATELMGAEPQALKARANRPIRNAVAYLRRPSNILLKNSSEKGTGSAIVIPNQNSKPGEDTQSIEMSKPIANSLADLFAGFASSLRNITGGKPAKALDVNTESGQTIVIEATGENDTPVVGDNVTLKDTGAAAPDGDYTASGNDKTVYSVAGGKITNIVKPEGNEAESTETENSEVSDSDKDKEIADLKKKIADMESAQANKDSDLEKRLAAMAKALGLKESKPVTVAADKQFTNQPEKALSAVERARARKAKSEGK